MTSKDDRIDELETMLSERDKYIKILERESFDHWQWGLVWQHTAAQLAEHADELEARLIAIGLDDYEVDSVPFDPEAHWETSKGRLEMDNNDYIEAVIKSEERERQRTPTACDLIGCNRRIAELESELKAAKSELVMTEAERNMAKNCVCKGNWRQLVKECEGLIGRKYRDKSGALYQFFGLVWGQDDFYYGLFREGIGLSPKAMLTSCVGTLEQAGFRLVED